ncbi:MAG TPA: TOBE-like domain-containing protein [Isosphaeraceae bacterium]|nr:TOBE-like domain-containing protein [Isosphaeraceae bacterium]
MAVPGPDGPVSVYVRPHDLDITRERNGRPAWAARITRLVPMGGLVRLDMTLLDGTSLHVQLPRDRCLELSLAHGEDVFVTPKDLKIFHDAKMFVENYVI